MFWSFTEMLPKSTGKTPQIKFIVVLFPEPLGPINPTISPLSTLKDRSSTALTPPKFFPIFLIFSMDYRSLLLTSLDQLNIGILINPLG